MDTIWVYSQPGPRAHQMRVLKHSMCPSPQCTEQDEKANTDDLDPWVFTLRTGRGLKLFKKLIFKDICTGWFRVITFCVWL